MAKATRIVRNGSAIDATMENESARSIIVHSAGSGVNKDYNIGLLTIIEGIFRDGNCIWSIVLDSDYAKKTLKLSEREREVALAYPIMPDRDPNEVRSEVQRCVKTMARAKNVVSAYGNSQRRLKIHFREIETCSGAEALEKDVNDIVLSDGISSTEKVQMILERVGQGRFRRGLLEKWGECPITTLSLHAVLRASHIKPWSRSTDEERMDIDNGLLLSANMDAMFDEGYISFDEDGRIMVSSSVRDRDLLTTIRKKGYVSFNDRQKSYMKYHRDNIFRYPEAEIDAGL